MGIEKRREQRADCYLHVRVRSSCDYLADVSESGARLMTCGSLKGGTVVFTDSRGEPREYEVVWCRKLSSGWTEAGLRRVPRAGDFGEDYSTSRMQTITASLADVESKNLRRMM